MTKTHDRMVQDRPEEHWSMDTMRVDLGDYIGKTLDLITAVDVEPIRVYGFILFVECLGAYAEAEYDYITTHV